MHRMKTSCRFRYLYPKDHKGTMQYANEKTEHSILPKIQKWQTFHLQRNYFILFYETFAYESN